MHAHWVATMLLPVRVILGKVDLQFCSSPILDPFGDSNDLNELHYRMDGCTAWHIVSGSFCGSSVTDQDVSERHKRGGRERWVASLVMKPLQLLLALYVHVACERVMCLF